METRILDFDESKIQHGDHIVRGVAAQDKVRAFAIDGRQTVQEIRDRHHTSPVVTAALGRLTMAAQMMGWMFKNPGELTTVIVRGDGPVGALTVTADNQGRAKGYANHPNVWLPPNSLNKLDVGGAVGAGTLTVIRDQPGVEPYSSQVELVDGEIADDLTAYFAQSDQVPSSVGLGVLVGRDQDVLQAGGFIIQLMPDCPDEVVAKLEANLAQMDSVTSLLGDGLSPTEILGRALEGLDFTPLEYTPAQFYCGCNKERAARILITLGPEELHEMAEAGEPAELYCHFCGKRYEFSPDEVARIAEEAAATE